MNKKEKNKIQKTYYKLFSVNLLRFIKLHGFRPISKGIHPSTMRNYWIFEMSDELSEVLTTWTKNKAKNGEENTNKNNKIEWKIGQ